jgi:hypothetical protein
MEQVIKFTASNRPYERTVNLVTVCIEMRPVLEPAYNGSKLPRYYPFKTGFRLITGT